jgi:hypothetical protein
MLDNDTIAFIIDLNELDDDHIEVSMDFTVNYGPLVVAPLPQPKVNDRVRLHSPDEDTLYWGTVVERLSDRDLKVLILWGSCTPVLNREWSAAEPRPVSSFESATKAAG